VSRLPRALLLLVLAPLLLSVGCDDDDDDDITEPPLSATLTANPRIATVGQQVTFQFAVAAGFRTVTETRIDYDADGTWDESRGHSSASVQDTFRNTYGAQGMFDVMAQALEGNTVLAERQVTVTVNP
jgi:hypothetical protein